MKRIIAEKTHCREPLSDRE